MEVRNIDCFPTEYGYKEMLGSTQLYQQLHALQQKYPDWDIFARVAECGICGKKIRVRRKYVNRSYKHNNYCPECREEKKKEWAREYYRRNREKVLERKREYRRKHADRVRRSKMMHRLRKWIMKNLPGVWW